MAQLFVDAADLGEDGSRRHLGVAFGQVLHGFDAAEVLGRAPKAGRPEVHAAYRAAWDALGRPHAERAELEMSEGQLLARSRSWERERKAAPRWVADELAGTRRAAAEQRSAAVLRRAEADAAQAADPQRATELVAAAAAAEREADDLDHWVGLLDRASRAYDRWAMNSAVNRLEGERADHALALLRADRPPDLDVTAEAWIGAQEAKVRAEEEAHRPITDGDVDDQPLADHDRADDRADDRDGRPDERERQDDDGPVLETDVPDIRDVAADEPAHREPTHRPRIAPFDEAVEANERARRSILDMQSRADYEAGLDTAEDRDADLSREDPFAAAPDDAGYVDE